MFSAGNGPGLGSLNRSGIYPDVSMRVGAFVGKELDEYVHGVTGLPEDGRVITPQEVQVPTEALGTM